MNSVTHGTGEFDDTWILKTPSLTYEYQAWRDSKADPPALIVQVGSKRLSYQLRASDNPAKGCYGLRKGYRGRFANYVTPVLELLGLVELEHGARGNRVRAR